jgi:CBS domain-containing protein
MHQSFLTLTTSVPVLQAGLMLTRHQARSVLVVNEAYELIGIVTLQDIRRAVSRWEKDSDASVHLPSEGTTSQTLGEICTKDLLYAYQDEPTSEALARMATRGLRQLPVVDRNDPTHILGLLEQEKVSLVFSLEMTQQLLQPYIEKPAVLAEPLNLSISEQSAA